MKSFKWYLSDYKTAAYNWLIQQGFDEDTASSLRYSFYEVEFDCEYKGGKIYVTHFEGVKLETPVIVGEEQ